MITDADSAEGDDPVAISRPRSIAIVAVSSSAEPRSTGVNPSFSKRASRVGRFESRIFPGVSRAPAATSSSPVESTPTRGRGITRTSRTPALMRTPRCAGESALPARTQTSPALTSAPASRTFSPGCKATLISTPSVSTSRVRSTMQTASAPGGIGAPVMTRWAAPSGRSRDSASPAYVVPETCRVTGAEIVSALRSA